jgi:hypothetical protein
MANDSPAFVCQNCAAVGNEVNTSATQVSVENWSDIA